MAVSTTNGFDGPYLANGATTTFPFTFTAPSAGEVSVLLRASDGTETVATGYTVTLGSESGGSVVFAVAPASGVKVIPYLDPEFTQQVEFEDGSPWLAAPVNEGYDRSAARDQALKRDVGRALLSPIDEAGTSLPSVASRVGKFLAFDAAGKAYATDGTGADGDIRADLAATSGSAVVGWQQSGTGAVARTVQAKLYDNAITPRDFDTAAGTGNATIDTAAINEALAEGAASRRVVLIDRPYLINGPLVRPSGSQLIGATMDVPLLILQAGAYDLFQFTGSWTRTENLLVDGALRTSGYDFNFDLVASAANQVEHRAKDLFFTRSTGGVKDNYVSGTAVVLRVYFKNVKWAQHRGHGVRFTRGFAFIYFDKECLVEYIGTTSPNWTGFYYDGAGLGAGAGGLHLGLSIAGTATIGATNATQIGFDIKNAAAVFFTERARAENMGGCGAILTSINGLDMGPQFGSYHCNDGQVRIVGCTQVTGNIDAVGRVGIGTPAASKHAVAVSGSDNLSMGQVAGKSATGDGINISTSTVVEIAQITGKSNVGRGWVTDATGVVGAKGGVLAANTAGNYSQGGALHTLRSVTLNSGSCVDVNGAATG